MDRRRGSRKRRARQTDYDRELRVGYRRLLNRPRDFEAEGTVGEGILLLYSGAKTVGVELGVSWWKGALSAAGSVTRPLPLPIPVILGRSTGNITRSCFVTGAARLTHWLNSFSTPVTLQADVASKECYQ